MFNIKNTIIMAEKFEKALADLRDEQQNEEFISESGSVEKFLDFLDAEEQERFHEMEELAEQKRKWLQKFEKMQLQISAGDFSEALETFGLLSQDMELV